MGQIVRFSLIVLIFMAAKAAFAYTSQECIDCHRTGSTESKLHISIDEFNTSIHAEEAGCQECHTLVEDEDHKIVTGRDRTAAPVLNVIPAIHGMECWPRTTCAPPFTRNA
jgi:hypothetical protein